MFPSSWGELSAHQFACAPELLSSSKLDILVDERGGTTRIDGALSSTGGVNLTCKVYSDPEGELLIWLRRITFVSALEFLLRYIDIEKQSVTDSRLDGRIHALAYSLSFPHPTVNPVWYKDEHRIHTMSELTEMATTIVISTLPPSSPGPNSPATPPEHVDVTPALFANPPLNYQLYSIYTSGKETKTSVLSIAQVNNDTKVSRQFPSGQFYGFEFSILQSK